VIAGILVALFGFLSMGYFSPSFSEEEHMETVAASAIIGLVGVMQVLLGWMLLRRQEKKGSLSGTRQSSLVGPT